MRLFYFCNANTGNILSRTSQDFWWAWSKNGNGFDCPVMNILIRYTSVPYQKNPTEQIHWWSRRRQAKITYSITLSSRNSRTGNKTKMSTPPLFLPNRPVLRDIKWPRMAKWPYLTSKITRNDRNVHVNRLKPCSQVTSKVQHNKTFEYLNKVLQLIHFNINIGKLPNLY